MTSKDMTKEQTADKRRNTNNKTSSAFQTAHHDEQRPGLHSAGQHLCMLIINHIDTLDPEPNGAEMMPLSSKLSVAVSMNKA